MHSWEEADVPILPGESGSQEAGAESVSLAMSICVLFIPRESGVCINTLHYQLTWSKGAFFFF